MPVFREPIEAETACRLRLAYMHVILRAMVRGNPGEQWATNLTEGGYEHHCRNINELSQIARFGFAWRRIFNVVELCSPASAFEIGCGGGEKLATLALNGFSVSGIDISVDVLTRARQFFSEIEYVSGQTLRIELIQGDIFTHTSKRRFDLVYHFGVVEHYLDAEQRAAFWIKAVELVMPGGWVVSVVPCGRHLMRTMMRERELCGYQKRLAEIDYSCASHIEEFQKAGLDSVRILPHSYFFFLSGHPNAVIRRVVFPLLFLIGNATLPALPIANSLRERFAHTLIAIGRKPI